MGDEVKARKKTRLLREALDAAHDAVVITDRRGIIEWVNPAFTQVTGFSESEALDRTPGELLASGEHDDAFYRDLWATILAGRVWRGRMVNRRKDGTIYPEDQTITPVRDGSGEIAHFIAIKRDISEQIAADDELRRTNRALRVISGGNRALVRSTTEEEILDEVCGVAVEVGGYRVAWIGYTGEEEPDSLKVVAADGVGASRLEDREMPLGGEGEHAKAIRSAIRERAPIAIRSAEAVDAVYGKDRGGLEPEYRAMVSIPLISEEDCLGAMSIYSDDPSAFDAREIEVLSELAGDLAHGIATHRLRGRQKELEERLSQSEKLRAVGQLAGGVAHDFNNYLTVITTLAGDLLDDPDLAPRARDELREIVGAAESSAQLTRQLLAFSRQGIGRVEVFDLNVTVRKIVSMLERVLGEAIDVSLELASYALPVRTDPGQLEQVIMNLAVNARDAMPEGGRLEIGTARRAGSEPSVPGLEPVETSAHAVLTVTDSGSGMSHEVRARVFEPFYTTKPGGTGLGLSTVYGIVKQAGGVLRLSSELGRGTCFEIHLPLREVEELNGLPKDRRPGSPSAGPKETVLVVEDQDAVRRAVARILQRFGYEVIECDGVAQALEWSRNEELARVDLLLTDLQLADGDGRDVAEAFLGRHEGLAVLYTSGYAPAALDRPLELAPNEGFLEKPFNPGTLASAVRAVLDTVREGGGEGHSPGSLRHTDSG